MIRNAIGIVVGLMLSSASYAAVSGQRWSSMGERYLYKQHTVAQKGFTTPNQALAAYSRLNAEFLTGEYDFTMANRTLTSSPTFRTCREYSRFTGIFVKNDIERQLRMGKFEVKEATLYSYIEGTQQLIMYRAKVLLPCQLKHRNKNK